MRVTPSNAPSKIMLFFRGIVAEFGVVAVAAAPYFYASGLSPCGGGISVRMKGSLTIATPRFTLGNSDTQILIFFPLCVIIQTAVRSGCCVYSRLTDAAACGTISFFHLPDRQRRIEICLS